jgi:dipeptidyl aminopeptidase/acylaminoacyl peptidase
MRAREYPGSDVVVETVLDPGVNYSRYIVSYLSDGLKINALMTVPNGEKPATGWPVIIFNHGYIPPAAYVTTERYVAYVDLIARSGYIVFKSDYRGHGNSEGDARGAYSYPDYTVDVLNAVASMKNYPDADPNRIGMWGHSMGGYITLRAMVISKDIKAGVIWAGVVASYPDLLTKWRRGPGASPDSMPHSASWRSTFVDTYGSPEENPQFWNSISANSYLTEISGPLQLHHGTADADVPLEFSETLFYQMLAVNQYVELYKYEGDNHNLSNYFITAMSRTIEFFDRFVK